MLEDPFDYTPQPESRFWKWTLIGWLFVVGLFGAGMVTCAQAAPMYEAQSEGIRIVLYDEPCALSAVSNLKLRAVWFEDGKSYEGCYGATPPLGVVMAYFADKTVAAIPMSAFHRVVGV